MRCRTGWVGAAIPWLLLGCSDPAKTGPDDPEPDVTTWYVSASAEDEGDGSVESPFATWAAVEAESAAGDLIYVVASSADDLLDGGIQLKAGQRLIGLPPEDADYVQLTNTTDTLDGVVVALSSGNEVAQLQFVDMANHAIYAAGVDTTGTNIHHCLFTGSEAVNPNKFSVYFEPLTGVHTEVRVTDSTFRDGTQLGGVFVYTQGDSQSSYTFARNSFSDLGSPAYRLWSADTSHIEVEIEDSAADNIGVGRDKNSDSIHLFPQDSSSQDGVVRNYQYDNSAQVGGPSNTGLELYMAFTPQSVEFPFGPCDGCSATLLVEDSLFENAVTTALQLYNLGERSEMDVAIRRTTIAGSQGVRGAIQFLNFLDADNRNSVLLEDSDVLDSAVYGVDIRDAVPESISVVDLGGGALGSAGNNRILGSADEALYVENTHVDASSNWWGGEAPSLVLVGGATVSYDPVLTADPRPD